MSSNLRPVRGSNIFPVIPFGHAAYISSSRRLERPVRAVASNVIKLPEFTVKIKRDVRKENAFASITMFSHSGKKYKLSLEYGEYRNFLAYLEIKIGPNISYTNEKMFTVERVTGTRHIF